MKFVGKPAKYRFQYVQAEINACARSGRLHNCARLPQAPHRPMAENVYSAIKNHLVVVVFALALLGMTGAFAWKLVKRVHEARNSSHRSEILQGHPAASVASLVRPSPV